MGILFYDAVKNAIQRGEFKLLNVPGLVIEAKSFVVYHNERPLSSAAHDFLDLLKKQNAGTQILSDKRELGRAITLTSS